MSKNKKINEPVNRFNLITDYVKKQKKTNSDTNIISQVPLDNGGITMGSFGSNFDKAKEISKAILSANSNYSDEDIILDILKNVSDGKDLEELNNILKDKDKTEEEKKEFQNKLKEKYLSNDDGFLNLVKKVIQKTKDISKSEILELYNSYKEFQLHLKNKSTDDKMIDYIIEKAMQVNSVFKDLVTSCSFIEKIISLNDSKIIKVPSDFEEIRDTINNVWDGLMADIDHKDNAKKLYTATPNGIGEGELFISSIFEDAELQGFSSSFDIKSDNRNYEVKCYKNAHKASIRLGTEGKVFNFDSFNKLTDLYKNIEAFINLSEDEMAIAFSMMASLENNNLYKDIFTDVKNFKNFITDVFNTNKNAISNSSNRINDSFIGKIRRGEFNTTDTVNIQNVVDTFINITDLIVENKFDYIKFLKNGEVFIINEIDNDETKKLPYSDDKTVLVKCTRPDDSNIKNVIEIINNVRKSIEDAVNSVGLENGDTIGEGFLIKLIKNVSEEISKDFENHPMILLNKLNDNGGMTGSKLCDGVYTKFMADKISQNGFYIKVLSKDVNLTDSIIEYVKKHKLVN